MSNCSGRHWFAYRGDVGSSSPVCTRLGCDAPNPNYDPWRDYRASTDSRPAGDTTDDDDTGGHTPVDAPATSGQTARSNVTRGNGPTP